MGISVLVVDDHAGFRSCARRLLQAQGFDVVGEAADCPSAVACARELGPELALVDVYLPGADGFEVSARLAALEKPPAIVLISSHDPAELEAMIPPSGARGFIPKELLSRETIEALL